jgi:hypothetical protein
MRRGVGFAKEIALRHTIACVTVLIGAALAIGCGSSQYVYLNHLEYRPDLSGDLEQYRGKAIVITAVYNRAEDTYLCYYCNPDRRLFYSTNETVADYFDFCFTKAFGAAGLSVHRASGPAEAPTFELILLSLTDQAARFHVMLSHYGRYFEKTYQISFPPIPEQQFEDEGALRKAAYRMVDQMVQTILTDSGFQTAFFWELPKSAN